MKRLLSFLIAVIMVAVCSAISIAATNVSQPVYITNNDSEYDRSPSIVFDGSYYWLFYVKGDDVNGVRGFNGYNPENDTYVVYYKRATSIANLPLDDETQLYRSSSQRPTNFDQSMVSAAYLNNKIYVFVSSGLSSADRGLYYYMYSGSDLVRPVQPYLQFNISG